MRQVVEDNKMILAAVLVIGIVGTVVATQTDVANSVTGSSADHSGDAMQAQGDAMDSEGEAMESSGDAMESERSMENDSMDSEDSMEQ